MNLDLTSILGSTKKIEQEHGHLLQFDFCNVDFIPKRLFVVNNVANGSKRGKHAHLKTRQCLVAINGSIDVTLDNGHQKVYCTLNKGDYLHQEPLQWAEFVFRDSASLLVICSTEHDESDYVRDYGKFKKLVGEQC